MAQIKAVAEAVIDPKAGGPRQKSGVAFPYYNLDDSIKVAKVIYENGGASDRVQLATLLGYKSVANGSFLTRVSAARMFGLIEQDGNKLRVSERGMKIVAEVDPGDADRAKVEAFLDIELFRKVFEEYNGRPLPPDVGLRNLLEQTHSVVKDRVVPTIRIMLDSAEQAGFFRVAGGNRSKMVKPFGTSSAATPRPVAAPAPAVIDRNPQPLRQSGGAGGGGGGNGELPSNIHPAIIGILKELPPAGSGLTPKKRTALISAFTATVDWIYPESEGEGS
ncbi:MAG: hypothetical protein H0T48_14380 [Gemmatimonadaceae bacterium]|nr:hypothetical protein [Gemmatimonadaceae bacterium]